MNVDSTILSMAGVVAGLVFASGVFPLVCLFSIATTVGIESEYIAAVRLFAHRNESILSAKDSVLDGAAPLTSRD